MIIYWLLLNTTYLSLRVYFRRIYITNPEFIPKKKPILFVSNHPNSFIDGILLAVLLRRKLRHLARGDAFTKSTANWSLRSMGLLPIFRGEETKLSELTERNKETFEECYALFKKNGSILIFPEGRCVTERRLRPLRKGTARIVFDVLKKYPELDLQIVPVGLNYSNPGHFRKEVCINFARPIPASDFVSSLESEKNYAKAILDFNARVYEEMERELVIIKNPEDDAVGNKYLLMARNRYKPSFWGFLKKTKKRFLAEKRAANDLNTLSETQPEKFEEFKKSIQDYFENLDIVRVKDRHFTFLLYEKILFLVFTVTLFQLALIGFVLNVLPVYLSNRIAKAKVKRIEFFDSVNVGSGAILAFVYILLLLAILVPFFGWYGILMVVGIRLLGYLFLFWKEAAVNTWSWCRILFSEKGRSMNRTLQSQRKFILEFFG